MTAADSSAGDLVRRFFAGVTEYAFAGRLGVADPPLVDYLTELLVRFVACDAVYSLRTPRGERLSHVADMLAEAQARHGSAKRRVHRHIGDFTLFWTGVYPEVVDRMRKASWKDSLLDYQDQGRRNYYLASQLPADRTAPDEAAAPDDVLARLSDHFELCVYGLGEVRKAWEDREGESGAPILLG